MKKILFILSSAVFLLAGALPAHGAKISCESVFAGGSKKVEEVKTRPKSLARNKILGDKKSEFHPPLEDVLIKEQFGDLGYSYSFWGQGVLQNGTYARALEALKSEALTVASIQKAHKILSGNKIGNFRETSDAKVIGNYSFKDFSALLPEQIRQVESNPFLAFVKSAEVQKFGILNKEIQVGDIYFPNVKTAAKFEKWLSKETRELVSDAKKDAGKSGVANQAILKDLLNWSLQEAQSQVQAGKEPAHVILALLEWRVKSLGLYYESTFADRGNHLEVALNKINQNRSLELAEAVVDVFAEKNQLIEKPIERGFRPQFQENFSEWSAYMKDSLANTGVAKILDLRRGLEAARDKMSKTEAEIFETYYTTRLLGGEKTSTTVEAMLRDFRTYMSVHYNNAVPEDARALLVPLSFIKTFGEAPKSFKDYYETYYSEDRLLFRGVSNTTSLTDKAVTAYFNEYKGRFASEVSRSVFAKRVDFTKLAMLRFNNDLIDGLAVENAAQHAAKHMGYIAPNSAKTYFVSATDLNTIAFRFAMDKGYIDRTSSTALGNTHMVFEFLQPKYGMVDFGSFKLTAPSWKNYFPRQRETSIVGGLDPHSLVRIYILAPYAAGEKIPHSGPEKHGKIVKVFERDENKPNTINVKLKNNGDQWVTKERFDLND